MNKKRVLLVLALVLIALLVVEGVMARKEAPAPKKRGIGGQFLDSFVCIFKCGWPAIVILILPAVAIYIYKKIFAWG